MSFSLEFDEVPLIVSGVAMAPVAGRADINSSGDVESLSIENFLDTSGRRLFLTGQSADEFKNMLFRLLAASIKVTCFDRIQDAMADYRRDNVASYHDYKRKLAAEMAS